MGCRQEGKWPGMYRCQANLHVSPSCSELVQCHYNDSSYAGGGWLMGPGVRTQFEKVRINLILLR